MHLHDDAPWTMSGQGTAPDTALREREYVRSEAIRMLMDSMAGGLGAGYLGLAAIAALLYRLGVRTWLGVWMASVASLLAVGFVAYLRYRAAPCMPADLQRWGRRFVWIASATALSWGSAAWYFLPGSPAVEMVTILGVSLITIGGNAHMAAHLPLYFGFLLAAELPFAIALGRIGDTLHADLSIGVLSLIVGLPLFAVQNNRSIRRSLSLAYRNRELAAALEQRTREAELANLAKSRFLAAASHDLRQPVHAFGLLLDVLRGQGLNRTQAETVDQLLRSSTALAGLFDGLLDVSKLDAGVVHAQVGAVALEPLLRALLSEFEPLADDKSLGLRSRLLSCTVGSDALLLERILRNLLANALRYTERGGVLLACRRRGPNIAIEVWDTGPGIAAHEQSAVFDEFYQCANAERKRSQGLGLGLAIVQRLARLLDHELEMRSVYGRGSLFRVSVPELVAVPISAIAPRAEPPVGTPLRARFVLVVEDDQAVREATVDLLRMWGAAPLALASMAAVAAVAGQWRRAPDLIVTDLRLPDQRDGFELIAWMCEEFNRPIPALVMTGDAVTLAPAEGLPGALHILHKPVAPAAMLAALRTLLANAPEIHDAEPWPSPC